MKKPSPKQVATVATKEAGKILLTKFKTLSRTQVQTKSKHEIVTPADLASEKVILRAIKKNFPDHRILSEEEGKTGATESDYLWIIDPLDGTTNFSMGNPLFSISIALAKKDEIIMGIIYVPFLDNLYFAETGKPSTLNGKKITVSSEKRISNSFLTFCHGNNDQAVRQAINIYQKIKYEARDLRQVGSAAIELSWVAQGKTEAIVIPGVNSWDVAAGTIIVKNAGGIVTDILGHNWNIYSEGIIASNKRINDELIRKVKNIK